MTAPVSTAASTPASRQLAVLAAWAAAEPSNLSWSFLGRMYLPRALPPRLAAALGHLIIEKAVNTPFDTPIGADGVRALKALAQHPSTPEVVLRRMGASWHRMVPDDTTRAALLRSVIADLDQGNAMIEEMMAEHHATIERMDQEQAETVAVLHDFWRSDDVMVLHTLRYGAAPHFLRSAVDDLLRLPVESPSFAQRMDALARNKHLASNGGLLPAETVEALFRADPRVGLLWATNPALPDHLRQEAIETACADATAAPDDTGWQNIGDTLLAAASLCQDRRHATISAMVALDLQNPIPGNRDTAEMRVLAQVPLEEGFREAMAYKHGPLGAILSLLHPDSGHVAGAEDMLLPVIERIRVDWAAAQLDPDAGKTMRSRARPM